MVIISVPVNWVSIYNNLVMSEISNYLKILNALQNEAVDFIIIDGIAVIFQGMPRASEDLDIVIK